MNRMNQLGSADGVSSVAPPIRAFRVWLAALIPAGVLYAVSMAPGVLWQDSGLAQIRVLTGDFVGQLGLALAHPLYYVLATAMQIVPIGDSAFRTNVVSAKCAAITIANLYLFLRLILTNDRAGRVASAVGAMSLALAHIFWTHAALAEVYTVSTMVLTFELLALQRFAAGGGAKWLVLAWGLNGLEWSNHNLALITAAAMAIWTVLQLRQGRCRWGHVAVSFVAFVCGGAIYEYFVIRQILAGMPIGEAIASMLVGEFGRSVTNVHFSARLLCMAIGGGIVLSFPSPNLLLVGLGWTRGWRRVQTPALVPLLAMLMIFHLAFAVRYNVPDVATFFIVPDLFLSVWLAIGAAELLSHRPKLAVWTVIFVLTNVPIYAVAPKIVKSVAANVFPPAIPYRDEAVYFLQPWKTGYDGPRQMVEELAAVTPANSVALLDSTTLPAAVYMQLVELARPEHEREADERAWAKKVSKLVFVDELCAGLSGEARVATLRRMVRERAVFVVRRGRCPAWITEAFDLVPAGRFYHVVEKAVTTNPVATLPR